MLFDQDNGQVPLYVFICISVVTTALCMLIAAAVVLMMRKLRKQTLSRNNLCLKATNRHDLIANSFNKGHHYFFRFGGQDFMNNEDVLIKDLISTRYKGVEEQKFLKDHTLMLPPVQLSPRSSLRSFFCDTGVLIR